MYIINVDNVFEGDHIRIDHVTYMITQISHNTTDKTIQIMLAESKGYGIT